jgi:enamine deaminase RidA (YjgF/YER057c/UK114 family)
VRLIYYAGLGILWSALARPADCQSNARFLNPTGLSAPHGYSHVVETPANARLVYLSGQVPLDSAGHLVGAGDFRAQTEQVFRNLGLALAGAGASFADIVKLNYFVRDMSHLSDLRAVRDRYVNVKAPPASTLVEVSRLFRDDVMLEIEAVAAVPAR